MSDFNINEILPMLYSMGISPDQLGPEKMKTLQQLANTISDPTKIGSEDATKILRSLGVGSKQNKQSKREKCGRNEKCICGSNKKYKKCCGL
jgi:uncharacterized protein YecA (UPF0149 family)